MPVVRVRWPASASELARVAGEQGGVAEALRAEILRTPEELLALRPEWEALHAKADPNNVFNHWIWVWQWWQAFAKRRGLKRDQLEVVVLRDDTREVRAIFPMVLTRWGVGRLSLGALRLYGYSGAFTELRAPLVSPGWSEAVAARLVHTIAQSAGRFQWCWIDGLRQGEAITQWFSAEAGPAGWNWGEPLTHYVLPLPASWEEFRRGLKRNIKESLRHCYNSLQREGHQLSFEALRTPEAIGPSLDEFFRQHAARGRMDSEVSHPDYFATAARREFFRGLALELARAGRLALCRLRINGSVVASRLVLTPPDGIYLYYSGYDPAWRHYSVATTLTAECIKWAISTGRRFVDLSKGRDVGKTRWGPEERELRSLRIVSPTPLARLIVGLKDRTPGNVLYAIRTTIRWLDPSPPARSIVPLAAQATADAEPGD